MVQSVLLIWLDNNIKENSSDCQHTLATLRRVINNVEIYTDSKECIEFLVDLKNDKACLIISGSLGQQVVPQIHKISQVDTIFIFCGNKQFHETWARNYEKIKGVFTEITPICEALRKTAHQCEQDAIPMSFVPAENDVSQRKLDQLDPSFMYTQIMKEILLTIHFEGAHVQEFLRYCQNIFAENEQELHYVRKLEREYNNQSAISWYTCESFLYPMLNRALRVMDADMIIKMGFFIDDLHRQIEKLHYEQFGDRSKNTRFKVYRGQGMEQIEFEKLEKSKGGLLSFNSFLSTSKERSIALDFAKEGAKKSGLVGIIFVMIVHPSQSTTPFASLGDLSKHSFEKEVLFAMNSIFRIDDIKQMNEYKNIIRVELTLTNQNDTDLLVLTDRMRQETFPTSEGWFRLGLVICKMGLPKTAEEIYKVLLEQEPPSRQAPIYQHLGIVKFEQGEFKEAITYYEKSLALRQQTLQPNHPEIAISYNNISNAYGSLGEYNRALLYQEKALEMKLKRYPPDQHDLAMSYNNLGSLYSHMRDYDKALFYQEKALGILQSRLPSNHPDLAMSYGNLGVVCFHRRDFAKALFYQEKALAIRQQSLPSTHPSFASTYTVIGSIHENMHDYRKALTFYEKAVRIGEQSLPSNHPNLLDSRQKLDSLKKKF